MSIQDLLRDAAFNQADIDRIVLAYEAALWLLRIKDESDPVCETLANKIIELTRAGERDAPHLCAKALVALGLPLPD